MKSYYREHWYSGIRDSLLMFVPGTRHYSTIAARRARTGYLFMLPFIIGFVLFLLKPLAESIIMSFSDVKLVIGEGYSTIPVGFKNYSFAINIDASYKAFLLRSLSKMLINTVAVLILSFVLAVLLNQQFKGRMLFRAILFLTVILSSGILPGIEMDSYDYKMMAGVSKEIANSGGVNLSAGLKEILGGSGMGAGMFDILFKMIDAIYDIVMASGIQIIVFLSGLQTIPVSMYEAAAVEGCNAWESFWKITFPMVCPLLLVNCIYTIIDLFTNSNNEVMKYIIDVKDTQSKYGLSSAMSWIYFLIAALYIGVCTLIIRKGVKSIND